MTQASSGTAGRTTDEAKHEAARVADESKDAGRRVAETAKDEAGRVASEAKHQAKRVLDEMSGELQKQAGEQQHRAAESLHSMGDEFESMSQKSEQQGMASDLVHQAGQRMHSVAGWLDQHDARSIVSEVKTYARKHPAAFVAIALGAGVVVGRFVRAASSEPHHEQGSGSTYNTGYAETTPVYEETVAEYEVPTGTTAGATSAAPVYEETVYEETADLDTDRRGEMRR